MTVTWNPSPTAGVTYTVVLHEVEEGAAHGGAGGGEHAHEEATAAVASACAARTEIAEGHATVAATTTATSVRLTGLKSGVEYVVGVLIAPAAAGANEIGEMRCLLLSARALPLRACLPLRCFCRPLRTCLCAASHPPLALI